MHKDPPDPNKAGPFPVSASISPSRIVHGTGRSISTTGLIFVLDFPLPGKIADIEIVLRSAPIPIRIQIKSMEPAGRQIVYTAKFSGIKADHWDRVVRYIQDLPDFEHVGSYFDPTIPDDDYRLLPLKIQQQIIAELVTRRRLIEPRDGAAPLMRMKKIGETRRKDGYVQRRISIQSRIILEDEGGHKDSDTIFTIDSEGNVEVR